MQLTETEYNEALQLGFIADCARLPVNSFAEACYNSNSFNEIKYCKTEEADECDCKNWNITPDEWREHQIMAICHAMFLYEELHSED